MDSKNIEKLKSFYEYCIANPDLRFWQALQCWSDYDKIYGESYDKDVDSNTLKDTFYIT